MTGKRYASPESQAFGEEVARLRSHRGWNRPTLLRHLDRVMGTDGTDNYEPLSEAWLHRLENGQVVKIPRRIIVGLCQALGCSLREQAKLLLLADRNALVDIPAQTPYIREIFHYMSLEIYGETCAVFLTLAGEQSISKLSDQECAELFFTAIELVIADRRTRIH